MNNNVEHTQGRSGFAAAWPDVLSPVHVDATDELVRRIQAELDHRHLSDWQIYAIDPRLGRFSDIDQYLPGLEEPESGWVPPLSGPSKTLSELHSVHPSPTSRPAGVLYHPRHEVLLIRWKMLCTDSMMWMNLEMVAARDIKAFARFEETIKAWRDDVGKSKWRSIPGAFNEESFATDRAKAPPTGTARLLRRRPQTPAERSGRFFLR